MFANSRIDNSDLNASPDELSAVLISGLNGVHPPPVMYHQHLHPRQSFTLSDVLLQTALDERFVVFGHYNPLSRNRFYIPFLVLCVNALTVARDN